MADTYTTNLNLTKPEPGAAEDTWGISLNADLDALDAIFSSSGTQVNLNPNQVNFADNKKAIFGTSSDLEIYHDGTHSVIDDVGTGNLILQTNGTQISLQSSSEYFVTAQNNGAVTLYHNGSSKLATTSSGIDVTGTITTDGLTSSGNILLDGSGNPFITNKTSGAGNNPVYRLQADTNYWDLQATFSNANDDLYFMYNGSVKAGITSGGSVGIGTTSPGTGYKLDITGQSGYDDILRLTAVGTNIGARINLTNTGTGVARINATNNSLALQTAGIERARIDSSGNFLVNTTTTAVANGTNTGIALTSGNQLAIGANNDVVAYLNRISTDGSIIEFRKNGSAVGSIGTKSSRPYLVNNVDGGINLSTDGYGRALLLPADQNGSPEDNLHYLGSSSYRWRDLYLSGAVNADKALLGRTASTSAKLHLEQATSVHMDMNSVGDNRGKIGSKVNDLYIGHSSGSARIYFKNNVNSDGHPADSGDTKMVITDTAVGIGTTSPDSNVKLDLNSGTNNVALGVESTDANVFIAMKDSGTTGTYGTAAVAVGANSDNLLFRAGSAEVGRFTSAGRFGIGTTSPSGNLHVVGASGGQGEIYVSDADEGTSGSDSLLITKSGTTSFIYDRDASSQLRLGAADNSGIVVIDGSNQRVGIGTSSPSQKLHVYGGSILVDNGSSAGTIYFHDTTNYINLSGDALQFANNGSERMRIDSSGNVLINRTGTSGLGKLNVEGGADFTNGNVLLCRDSGRVGIGTSSPNRTLNLHVAANDSNFTQFTNSTTGEVGSNGFLVGIGSAGNAELWNYEAQPIIFATSSSERARIDSSGNLLVGTTDSTPNGLTVNGAIVALNDGTRYAISLATSTTASATAAAISNTNGLVGSITTSGSATQYNTSSDARLKDVTGEARGLEVINELNPVAYNWKADGKADEGLIAQEVLNVVPNAVSQNEDEYYQMDYSKLVTPLIKAVQELSNEVNELKQEIQNLKGE